MVLVRVPPLRAFQIFTEETDLWWRRGPRFRFGGARRGVLSFEPGEGGRLFERYDEGGPAFEVGKVLAWRPGEQLRFEWRLPNFAPAERTEVDVRFEQVEAGTRVTVEHRGWSTLRPDHPVRHGQSVSAFIARSGAFWGDLLTALRLHATAR